MKKGQSSVEFLLITGVGLLLITTVAFGYLSVSRGSEDKVRLQQVSTIGTTILQQASTVYALGANSWVSVDVELPDNVMDVYVAEKQTLVFDVVTQNGVVKQPVFSPVPINGSIDDPLQSSVYSGSIVPHKGNTRLRITSYGNYVEIRAIS